MSLPPEMRAPWPEHHVAPGLWDDVLRILFLGRGRGSPVVVLGRTYMVPKYRVEELVEEVIARGWFDAVSLEVTEPGRRRLLAAFPDLEGCIVHQGRLL